MADDSTETELPRAVALAWGVAANPQRGPKREMSIERIVEVAMQLADAGGLAAVSMAAVAAELGFTPMSLYRYVSAKDDLVLLMQEGGIGVPPESVVESEGWRAGLRAWAQEQLAAYLDHPWLLDIPITSLPITPNNLAWFDAALQVLAPSGLSADEQTSVVLAVEAQARWEGTVRRGYADAAADAPGARDAALLAALVTPEQFPAVASILRAGGLGADRGDDPFVFGLERVLDGVERYLAGRSPAAPPAPTTGEQEAKRDPRYKEAVKARREVEKKLTEARKRERELLKAAMEKLSK
ncbi:MAG TPA: TetR/AcrR family transcriptional regulator C-terminal domain-containing protein [Pseudolysinimonas sp.]|jgi:AcrR family transcriptional regulator